MNNPTDSKSEVQESSRRRARWFRALRWLVTAIGCYWIATSLTLDDHLVLPAGFAKDGVVLIAEAQSVPVVELRQDSVVIELRGQRIILDRDVVSREDVRYRPGLRTVISSAKVGELVLAALLVWPAQVLLMERWWQLMAAKGLRFSRGRLFCLHMASDFFGTFTPGRAGAEVVRLNFAMRLPRSRTAAATAIIVDRMFGIIALLVLAAVAAPFISAPEGELVRNTWGLLLFSVASILFYYSNTVRALPGIAELMRVLRRREIIRKIDDAMLDYRRHPAVLIRITVLSFLIHGFLFTSAIVASRAVGMETELPLLVAALAVLFVSASLPISFMGFGVMEPLGVALLSEPGSASAAQIVAMLVLYRCFILQVGLVGSLFVLRGDLTLEPTESSKQR